MLQSRELVSLLKVAKTAGIPDQILRATIGAAVMAAYKAQGYPSDASISVAIDELNGTVSIVKIGHDATPDEFRAVALDTAQTAVIELLKDVPETKSTTDKILTVLVNLIFWSYNGLYCLALILYAIVIQFDTSTSRNMLGEAFMSQPIEKRIILPIFFIIPFITIIYAAVHKLFRQPARLLRLYFLVEVPVLFLLLLRLLLPMSGIPAISAFTVVLAGAPILLLFPIPARVRLFVHEIPTLVVGYLTLLISFFIPPIVWSFIQGIIQMFRYTPIYGYIYRPNPLEMLMYIPLILLGAAFLLFPYLLTYVLVRSTYMQARNLAATASWSRVFGWLGIGVLASIISVLIISIQPASDALLEKAFQFNSASSFETKEQLVQEIMKNPQELQLKLRAAYSAKDRYPFAADDDSIYRIYQRSHDEATARRIQSLFITLAHPFVYQGNADRETISELHQKLFGTYVFSSDTWKPEPQVKILSRNVTTVQDPPGFFATVTVEETYSTDSFRAEEVRYEFSLPDEAVVTGLRLGPDLEFEGIIAPAGAAERTYEREVSKSRDPALLQQIGPRQYRLRVFPIPGKNDTATLGGRNQKMSYTYMTPVTLEGIPLPIFSKKENVTEENAAIEYADTSFIKAQTPVQRCAFPGGTFYREDTNSHTTVTAYRFNESLRLDTCDETLGYSFPPLRRPGRIAILADISYANRDSAFFRQLQEYFQQHTPQQHIQFDLYVFNTQLSPARSVENFSYTPAYFGTSDLRAALRQLTYNEIVYDTVIVHTGTETTLPDVYLETPPLYIVHDDEKAPTYTQAFTQMILLHNGRVLNTFEEAISAVQRTWWVDGVRVLSGLDSTLEYTTPFWSIMTKPVPAATTEAQLADPLNTLPPPQDSGAVDDELKKIAAKASIYYQIQRSLHIQLNNTAFLDSLHMSAMRHKVVTPYSSLIALVNAQQMQLLAQETQSSNRYGTSGNQSGSVFDWSFGNLRGEPGFMPAGGNSDLEVNLGWSVPSSPFGGYRGISSGGSLLPFIMLLVLLVPVLGGIVVGLLMLVRRRKKK